MQWKQLVFSDINIDTKCRNGGKSFYKIASGTLKFTIHKRKEIESYTQKKSLKKIKIFMKLKLMCCLIIQYVLVETCFLDDKFVLQCTSLKQKESWDKFWFGLLLNCKE